MEPVGIASQNQCGEAARNRTPERQAEGVYTAFMEGKDVFVSLPTGYRKTLIYALLPYAFDSITSPDSLQARPCNLFLFFLASPEDKSPRGKKLVWSLSR